MPENAQWEIQKLVENREHITSARSMKREYEICGLVERPRRKINHASTRKPWFWQSSPKFSSQHSNSNRISKISARDKRDQVEWILILRGKIVDCGERTGLGGEGREEEVRKLQQRQLLDMRNQAQAQVQALRQREQKRVLSREEVEAEMVRMCRDLFRLQQEEEEEESESGSEDMDTDDEEEDEDEGIII